MTRKPFELAYLPTSNPSPSCVGEPRNQRIGTEILLHHQIGGTARVKPRQPRHQQLCRASLPTRIGGFDQIRSNVRTAGTCSEPAVLGGMDIAHAVQLGVAAGQLKRAFVHIQRPHVRPSGDSKPNVSAIGPQPQPRSRNVPSSGGSGAWRSSTDVPRSTRCRRTRRSTPPRPPHGRATLRAVCGAHPSMRVPPRNTVLPGRSISLHSPLSASDLYQPAYARGDTDLCRMSLHMMIIKRP